MKNTPQKYLRPTEFLDYEHASVQAFVDAHTTSKMGDRQKAVQLYYAVRDTIRYDPYDVPSAPSGFKASSVIEKGSGYCVTKAILLAAAVRSLDIPARLGFSDVTNHLSSKKLQELMGSNLFIYHGYTEMHLSGKWVKATPAFNSTLCERFHVKPLQFDGEHDCLFHPFDAKGNKHMEYVKDHGTFADLPFERVMTAYRKQYPRMFERLAEMHAGESMEDPHFLPNGDANWAVKD